MNKYKILFCAFQQATSALILRKYILTRGPNRIASLIFCDCDFQIYFAILIFAIAISNLAIAMRLRYLCSDCDCDAIFSNFDSNSYILGQQFFAYYYQNCPIKYRRGIFQDIPCRNNMQQIFLSTGQWHKSGVSWVYMIPQKIS